MIAKLTGATRSITVRATSADGSFSDQILSIALNDVDEFDVTVPVDTDGSVNSLAENSASGALVGITASAFDADATSNSISYSLADDAGGRFAIDSVNGVVRVANGSLLDYEAASSHTISVRATSADGSQATRTFTIQLTDVNEFAISPIVDANGSSDFTLENSSLGATVGLTASAYDFDGTATVAYSLDDDAGGRFTIDSNTGVITVAGAIDREADSSLTIIVRATSSDTSSSTQLFTIQIGDVDEFDVGTINDVDASVNSVDENSPLGTLVGIAAFAIDSDATNNAMSYMLANDDGGRFAIDSSSGAVTVAGALDRETDGPYRTVTVRATSTDGSVSELQMTIAIRDVNEAPLATGQSFTTNNVQTLTVGSAVLMSGMSDVDGDSLTAQLASGPTHGVLILNSDGSFQYSADAGFVGTDSFTVRAFDGQLQSSPVTVTIVVTLPPVNQNGGGTGGGSSTGNNTGGTTTSSSTDTTTNSNTDTSDSATSSDEPSGNSALVGADNSKIAERSMVAQQSAEAGEASPTGTFALTVGDNTQFDQQQVAAIQLAGLNWDPLTVTGISSRDNGEAAAHLVARRMSELPFLDEREISQDKQVEEKNFSSFVEPAKWTVISTGVVIWAVRLGHIITTFASTASAWVYFDPLTVIQSVKDKSSSDDHVSEAMFETSQTRSKE